ncbi:MAG: ABC transporter substrate-binding protein [Clostridia bacterium]|nr:ABC transporter substrate-binding protein [Clostridia bacterium]
MIKKITAAVLALIMLLSFAACGDNGEDSPTETPSTTSYIREVKTNVAAVKDITGLGISKLAKDRDYAYSVNYCDDVQQVKELISSGKADIAAMDIAEAVELYNSGADIKVIAVNNLASMYVIEKGNSVSSFSNLKKKTVYALKTDHATELFVKTSLADNGVDVEKDIDIQYFENISEISAAIADKDEYILMLTGPEAAKLPADESRKVVIDMTAEWIGKRKSMPVHSCVVARSDYIEANPEIIDEFRMFNEVSVNFLINNAEAGAIHLYSAGMFESAEIAMTYIASFSSIGYAEKEEMMRFIDESLRACIESGIPGEDFYYLG